MTRRSLLPRGARRRVLGAVTVAVALATIATVGVRPTSAAWVTTAQLGQSVGVASSGCTTQGVYDTTSSSRFLAGSVAGVPLTGSTALAALTATNPASTATFTSGATPRGGGGATTAVPNSGVGSALQAAGGVAALSAPSGSQTQYAAATSTGTSIAGAGSVLTTGAIDTAGIAGGTSPAVGTVDVSGVLAAVQGGTAAAGRLSQLGLTIGGVAAASTLNECARRWGASLSTALTRSTSLSGLSLSMRDAALTTLLGSIATQQGAVSSTFAGVDGTDATSSAAAALLTTARTGLAGAVSGALSAIGASGVLGTTTGSVSISSDLSGATRAAAETATDGTGLVSVNGAGGGVAADLTRLQNPTSPAPNTAVLTSGDATSIATGLGTAAGALVGDVGTAWNSAASAARISVDITVPVTVPVTGLPLVTVEQQMSGSLADFLDPSHNWPSPLVSGLGALNASAFTAALTTSVATLLLAPVRSRAASAVSSPLSTAITGATSTLSAALATARGAFPTELARLSTLFGITLDEQPDVAPYPTAAPGLGAGFVTTALRVHVRVSGADALDLAIASVSVGPDTTVNQ